MSDTGDHLLLVARLTFDVVSDPDEALNMAVSLVAELLSDVEPSDRAPVGAALVAAAMRQLDHIADAGKLIENSSP